MFLQLQQGKVLMRLEGTFSPMASWTAEVSSLRPCSRSPDLTCWSKKAGSWRSTACRYCCRSLVACLAPARQGGLHHQQKSFCLLLINMLINLPRMAYDTHEKPGSERDSACKDWCLHSLVACACFIFGS